MTASLLPTYSPPKRYFDWGRFEDMSKSGPDPDAIDRAAIARSNAMAPYSWLWATFNVPTNVTGAQYLQIRNAKLKKWVNWMAKRGWHLAGRIRVELSPFPATRPAGSGVYVPVEGDTEMTAVALFKKEDVKLVRIEIPG